MTKELDGNWKFIIGLSIMIGSIFVLCSATAFHSWIAFIPAIGSLPIFFIGLRISVDGANSMDDSPTIRGNSS